MSVLELAAIDWRSSAVRALGPWSARHKEQAKQYSVLLTSTSTPIDNPLFNSLGADVLQTLPPPAPQSPPPLSMQTPSETPSSTIAQPALPLQLHSLQGARHEFEMLHRQLRGLEDAGGDQVAIEAAHDFLNRSGPNAMHAAIDAYFKDDVDLNEDRRSMISALDVQLFMRHDTLIEDLSHDVLTQWQHQPRLFCEGSATSPESIREKLYGKRTRFPIPQIPNKRSVSARRRQFTIERATQKYALQEYLELQNEMIKEGQGSNIGPQKKIWMEWVRLMAIRITDLRDGSDTKKFRQHENLVCQSALQPELLAIITCQTVLNNLMVPYHARRKKDKPTYGNLDVDDIKCVPFARAVVSVGEAVSMENSWKDHHDTGKDKRPKPGRMSVAVMASMLRKSRSQTRELDLKSHIVPIGAALIDILLSCAIVRIPGGPSGPELAFTHTLRREGKKTVGYIELKASVCRLMDFGRDDMLAFLAPKHQPMVIPPRPWQPSAEPFEGGFLMHRVPFIRTSNQKATHLKVYDTRRVSRVMDALGSTRWCINKRILTHMEDAWERDLGIAELPSRTDPVVEEVPSNFSELPEEEQQELKIRCDNARRRLADLRSERPTFELKLKVARDFENAESLYFPHNIDFRGRAYPIPPHLNHIGDDVCRGLLMFANPKPLGEEGLYWLKINLANLLGKDKLTFEDRITFIEQSKPWIIEVAKDPMSEANLSRWVNADDGPWQALARCFELADAWDSPDPKAFLSHLPVHMDGSCNGLQHYAALGRDEEGGKAVNLTPSDKPQDVYSIVLEIVKKKVADDAAKEIGPESSLEDKKRHEYASRLQELGLLKRKVVKQTIMTICYGVTAIGAKEQVQRQLVDMIGEEVEVKKIKLLAGYLSQLVLKSIHEVFERAMKIKKWFDAASKVLNKLEVPVQWFSPIGLACTQPYRQQKKIRINTKLQNVTLFSGREGPKVDKTKQRMGFPPNFVHSLDGSHMMMVAEGCRDHGINFAGVHDSFWTHACDATLMNRIIREKFLELHSKPILTELDQDLRLQLGKHADALPPLPEPSTLDLELVLDSPYMFD